jgi:hypothetical protein
MRIFSSEALLYGELSVLGGPLRPCVLELLVPWHRLVAIVVQNFAEAFLFVVFSRCTCPGWSWNILADSKLELAS